LVCSDGSPCHRPTSQGLRFSTYYRKGHRQWCSQPESTLCVAYVSAVEAPKVTQISLSEPSRSLSGDTATDHGICFPFELCFPTHGGRSDGVHFLRRFLYELPLCRYKAFKSPTLFSKLRTRLPDTFHHLVSNNNFHCDTHLKKAKFDLFGSENASCQIRLQIENDSHTGYSMQKTICEKFGLLTGW